MESRLVEIETKLAYTEDIVHQLNQVVTDQQKRLMDLESTCEALKERISTLGQDSGIDNSGHQLPPHY